MLAGEAERLLLERLGPPDDVERIDLRETPLPMCDGDCSYEDPRVEVMTAAVARANGIILAVPIYNYDVNAAAKNLIELTGEAWRDKTVAFLCAAGGQGSYMSVMALANSLMLDFRCVIVPRFVYATGEDFENGSVSSPKIRARLGELCDKLVALGRCGG